MTRCTHVDTLIDMLINVADSQSTFVDGAVVVVMDSNLWNTIHAVKTAQSGRVAKSITNEQTGRQPSPIVTVRTSYGPLTTSVDEHHAHMRHFHTELGRLLDEMEAEDRAAVEDVS